MKSSAIQILKSNAFKLTSLVLTGLLVAAMLYYSSIQDVVLFPDSSHFSLASYTDDSNKGNSEVVDFTVSDSLLHFSFLLKEGFLSPYAGLSITPKSKLNFTHLNEIQIEIAGENINRIGLGVYTPPLRTLSHQVQDETVYHSYLDISAQRKKYALSVEQLKIPEWWEDMHQISSTQHEKLELNQLLHLNIGSAFSPDMDGVKTLKIYSIVFTRNNRVLFMQLFALYFICLTLSFTIPYLLTHKQLKKQNEITIHYNPVVVGEEKKTEGDCIEYINRNFHHNELNLELIAKETGIPKRRITEIISTKYQCNFKTYINRLRINEAKRLLNKSDMNMGEIAYKVGFNSLSHFNRVFKAEMQINPSEYRDNQS